MSVISPPGSPTNSAPASPCETPFGSPTEASSGRLSHPAAGAVPRLFPDTSLGISSGTGTVSRAQRSAPLIHSAPPLSSSLARTKGFSRLFLGPFEGAAKVVKALKLGLFIATLMAPFSTQGVPHRVPENALISDSETEQLLQDLADMARGAHPSIPSTLPFFIIANPTINAFTAGEPSVFIHTGLICQVSDVGQLASVVWHELGHMTKRHVSRHIAHMRASRHLSILPSLVGLIAAGLTRQWEMASLGMAVGDATSLAHQMGHSRDQEFFADQFAAQVFTKLALTPKPLTDLLAYLGRRESSDFAYYLRTHPFSQERSRACQGFLAAHTPKNAALTPFPTPLQEAFWRVKAKTLAFFTPLPRAHQTLTSSSLPAWAKAYGQAVLAYRKGDLPGGLSHLAAFEKTKGPSAFTHELRAQILFESGKLSQALTWIEKARSLRPWDPHLLTLQAQMMLENKADPRTVVARLEPLVPLHPFVPELWHWLGIAYGRLAQLGRMKVCLAEKALLSGNVTKAGALAKDALISLPKADPYVRKAQDLLDLTKKATP